MPESETLFESRGIHTRGFNGATNDWVTPKALIAALGPFDLDPCASVNQPWPCAAESFTYRDDGLAQPWHGMVWLNPPYGPNTGEWLAKLARHGEGIAIVPARTETQWFSREVWLKAWGLLFLQGRVRFHRPSGEVGTGNAGHSSVLVAYGKLPAVRLQLSGIHGALVKRWRPV